MNWMVPAKTFLLGEYVAVRGGPAILLTTTPCFKIRKIAKRSLKGIHPESPAGQYWAASHAGYGLEFIDPYSGTGGLGASSAQFLGAYFADPTTKNDDFETLLEAYYQYAWQGKGARPSGYDVLAQALSGCVYCHKKEQQLEHFSWPFEDMDFILVHTQKKLATHHHLQSVALPIEMSSFYPLVTQGLEAFKTRQSHLLVEAVDAYGKVLEQHQLVAQHSQALMRKLKTIPGVLALKGCGAMGADILLLLVAKKSFDVAIKILEAQGKVIIATSRSLF